MADPILSLIILNYNSGNYLKKCLKSISKSTLPASYYEVIVIDNASTDNSANNLPRLPNLKVKKLAKNLGFSKGNNFGLTQIAPKIKYIFFLNPDTEIDSNALKNLISTFSENKKIAAISPYITLYATKSLQPESHRSFPNPINSLLYFLNLSRSNYLPAADINVAHQIPAGVGAAIAIRKSAGEKIKWWDESYFMYGEDLQLCWDLKENSLQLWFIPNIKIIHYQGVSSGIKNHTNSLANNLDKKRSIQASTQAMKIFYQKNLSSKYPKLVNSVTYFGIKILEKYRLWKKST